MIRIQLLLGLTISSLYAVSQNNPITFDPGGGASGDLFGIKATESGNNSTKLHIFKNFSYESQDVDRFVIDAGGKIGVGTTSPQHNLQLVGTGEQVLGIWTQDDRTRLHFRKMNTTQDGSIVYHTNGRLGFHLDDASTGGWETNEYLSVLNDGRVGIGTSTPDAALHIQGKNLGNGNVIASIMLGKNNGPEIQTIQQSSDSDVQGLAFRVKSSPTNADPSFEAMRIRSNGNIGIGTNSPAYKLDLNGDLRIGHNQHILGRRPDGNTSKLVGYIPSESGHHIIGISGYSSIPSEVRIFTPTDNNQGVSIYSDRRLVFFRNDGNVGIGVNNPDEKLVVDGKIRSEEVKVEIINGPDYVFQEDYDLRTLEETKAYIVANKHLPEIPSAKEMETNGVALGDMNMRLLKKIEELTLYQIELLEKVEELQDKVKRLEEN